MSLDLSSVNFNKISYGEESSVSNLGMNANTGAPFPSLKEGLLRQEHLLNFL